MTEEEDLLSRISHLAGQINLHKDRISGRPHHPQFGNARHLRGPSATATTYDHSLRTHSTISDDAKVHKGRNRSHLPQASRNKTLVRNKGRVLANKQAVTSDDGISQTQLSSPQDTQDTQESAAGWVSKRDRHMQLINASIYDRNAHERVKAIETTRQAKAAERDAQELRKIGTYFGIASNRSVTQQRQDNHRIELQGMSFRVCQRGSKLARIKGHNDTTRITPKSISVGGVPFYRSKNGNLYRAGLVNAARKCPSKKLAKPCKRFSTTGQCVLGPRCPYTHDPDKVAICRDFLRTGECGRGDRCDLSHNPTFERVPVCSHFLRGNCSRPECRYAHVKVNPAADICRIFVTLGFCQQGARCDKRHMFECPDYSSSGACRRADCRLPHIDRAGQLRHNADILTGGEQQDELSDLSSDDEDATIHRDDDIDSDELEDDFPLDTNNGTEFLADDFVRI